jgi:hypothetical protein
MLLPTIIFMYYLLPSLPARATEGLQEPFASNQNGLKVQERWAGQDHCLELATRRLWSKNKSMENASWVLLICICT